MEYKVVTVCVFLCVLASYVPELFGCSDFEPHMRSPSHDEKDEQKVYYSEYVVFGKAGRTRKGAKFPFTDIDGVRTIEFNVICSYKAPSKVPEMIYVAGVGNRRNQVDGCPPAPLEDGQSAVLFLRKLESDGSMMDNMFEIEFSPISDKNIDDEQKIDDLTLICGLTRTFPGEELEPIPGSEQDQFCFEPLGEDYCSSYTPKTPKPEIKNVTSTPAEESTTVKTMEPTPETGPSKGGDNIGKPISPDNNATYSTDTGGSKGPKDGASMQYLSQSLVIIISVLFILV